jgi:hypothetical protein
VSLQPLKHDAREAPAIAVAAPPAIFFKPFFATDFHLLFSLADLILKSEIKSVINLLGLSCI